MTRIRWTAGPDRIAHAVQVGPRAMCGEPATEERLAWTPFRRCLVCSHLVAAFEEVRPKKR